MTTNLDTALQITALGMGLVFLGIIIIWLIIVTITASTTRMTGPAMEKPEDSDKQHDLRVKAASIAVAAILAEQRQAGVSRFPIPPTALLSARQLIMRTRQLNREANHRSSYQGRIS